MTILKKFSGLAAAALVCALLPAGPAYGQESGFPVVFTSTGETMTAGGTGTAGFSGDGGPAGQAQFNAPSGVAAGAAGTVYIVDAGNGRIRTIDPDGNVRTLAGGEGEEIDPTDVEVDSAGMVYISEASKHVVHTVDESGSSDAFGGGDGSADALGAPSALVTTAGDGTPGFSGDGGPATDAQLNSPSGLATDRMGNLYIADTMNHRIRMVDTAGVITTVAGNGEAGSSGSGGRAADAQLNSPRGIAVDIAGNLYIADTMNHRILKVDTLGVITVAAGTGAAGFSGDGGRAASAQLKSPHDVEADVVGNLYIADTGNGRVRRVNTAGMIETALEIGSPMGLALTPSGLYVTDSNNHNVQLVQAAPSLDLTMYAQPGMLTFMVNQDAAAAQRIALVAASNQAANLTVAANRSWISVSPSSVELARGEWAPVTVTVDPNELAQGSTENNGEISVMLGDQVVARVAVMVEVLPPLGPAVSVNEGVVNAARMTAFRTWVFGPQLLPLAPGSLITVRGANFIEGETPLRAVAFPLPTSLGGVRLKLNGVAAPLRMVGPNSIEAQVPWGLVPNPRSLPWVQVVVETAEGESYPRRFLVAPHAPGVFAASGTGMGQAAAIFVDPVTFASDPAALAAPRGVTAMSRPARAGDTLAIQATGMGPVTPPLGDGMNSCMPAGVCQPDGSNTVLRQTIERPRVWIGGMEVPAGNIIFSGMAPDMAATSVVLVRVPAGIEPSNAAEVIVSIAGRTTQSGVTIAVE